MRPENRSDPFDLPGNTIVRSPDPIIVFTSENPNVVSELRDVFGLVLDGETVAKSNGGACQHGDSHGGGNPWYRPSSVTVKIAQREPDRQPRRFASRHLVHQPGHGRHSGQVQHDNGDDNANIQAHHHVAGRSTTAIYDATDTSEQTDRRDDDR